jgi:hypothetical protein
VVLPILLKYVDIASIFPFPFLTNYVIIIVPPKFGGCVIKAYFIIITGIGERVKAVQG